MYFDTLSTSPPNGHPNPSTGTLSETAGTTSRKKYTAYPSGRHLRRRTSHRAAAQPRAPRTFPNDGEHPTVRVISHQSTNHPHACSRSTSSRGLTIAFMILVNNNGDEAHALLGPQTHRLEWLHPHRPRLSHLPLSHRRLHRLLHRLTPRQRSHPPVTLPSYPPPDHHPLSLRPGGQQLPLL